MIFTSGNSNNIIVKIVCSFHPHFFTLGLQIDEEPLGDVRDRTCLRHVCGPPVGMDI